MYYQKYLYIFFLILALSLSFFSTSKVKAKAFFIDDMISEFESLDWPAIGVTTLAAGWGYNNLADNTQLILKTIKGHLDDLHH